MFFLLSGEGATDLGVGNIHSSVCDGDDFLHGPLTIIVDQIVERKHKYSLLEARGCGYVSERYLSDRAAELKVVKKALRLPGKRQARETRYYFNNARILSRIAKEQEAERKDDVVAVLFRDSDGTASAGRGLWADKRQSILDGFHEEGFSRGVPMIPKPKSEAWLICALKENPYRFCEALEQRSGNDHSPDSLKKELNAILGEGLSRERLCQMVLEKIVNIERISMPSFAAFQSRLNEVI